MVCLIWMQKLTCQIFGQTFQSISATSWKLLWSSCHCYGHHAVRTSYSFHVTNWHVHIPGQYLHVAEVRWLLCKQTKNVDHLFTELKMYDGICEPPTAVDDTYASIDRPMYDVALTGRGTEIIEEGWLIIGGALKWSLMRWCMQFGRCVSLNSLEHTCTAWLCSFLMVTFHFDSLIVILLVWFEQWAVMMKMWKSLPYDHHLSLERLWRVGLQSPRKS